MTTLAATPSDVATRPASQTLDRGLQTLEVVAGSERPMSVAEVAGRLGLHRSIAYRMLRTLEDHGLVQRDSNSRFSAGAGLAVLARQVFPSLQSLALPELSLLANKVGKTAFMVVRQGDEAITVAVVEPRHSVAHVAYRPGTRHPVDRGAPGLALLSGAPAVDGERPEVALCRSRGWVSTRSEVLPGMCAVASPVLDRHGNCPGAVAVVFVADGDIKRLGGAVRATASVIGKML